MKFLIRTARDGPVRALDHNPLTMAYNYYRNGIKWLIFFYYTNVSEVARSVVKVFEAFVVVALLWIYIEIHFIPF